MSGIDYNILCSELIKKIEELHYSRLPVYRNNLDEVVGILNTKDLLDHTWMSLLYSTGIH